MTMFVIGLVALLISFVLHLRMQRLKKIIVERVQRAEFLLKTIDARLEEEKKLNNNKITTEVNTDNNRSIAKIILESRWR